MVFKLLSLLIALLCLGKASTALLAPHLFYRRRRQQYESAVRPRSIFIVPMLVWLLTAAAWYALVFHYQPEGWIVTGFLSVIALLALRNLWRWRTHRAALLDAIQETNAAYRRRFDVVLFIIGSMFMLLGVVVR